MPGVVTAAAVIVSAVRDPALSVVKTATPTTYATVGTIIGYSYVVSNSGNVTLKNACTRVAPRLIAASSRRGSSPTRPAVTLRIT